MELLELLEALLAFGAAVGMIFISIAITYRMWCKREYPEDFE